MHAKHFLPVLSAALAFAQDQSTTTETVGTTTESVMETTSMMSSSSS